MQRVPLGVGEFDLYEHITRTERCKLDAAEVTVL